MLFFLSVVHWEITAALSSFVKSEIGRCAESVVCFLDFFFFFSLTPGALFVIDGEWEYNSNCLLPYSCDTASQHSMKMSLCMDKLEVITQISCLEMGTTP